MNAHTLAFAIIALTSCACTPDGVPLGDADAGRVLQVPGAAADTSGVADAATSGRDGATDTRPDALPETPCVVEGASFRQVHEEGLRTLDLEFTDTPSPLSRLEPLFEYPLVTAGEVMDGPEGIRFVAEEEGLEAELFSTPYGPINEGTSLEVGFAPLYDSAQRLSGQLRVVVLGQRPGGRMTDVILDVTWSDGVIVMEGSSAHYEHYERASAPLTIDGSELTLSVVTDRGFSAVLSKGDEVLAQWSLGLSLSMRFDVRLSVRSNAQTSSPTPIMDLRSISSEDLRFDLMELWQLDAPILMHEGEIHAHAPDHLVPYFVGARWRTRAKEDPDGEPLNFNFLGPFEPVRYYLIEDTRPDGTVLRSTAYSTRSRESVLSTMARDQASRVEVVAEGLAFIVDGETYTPAFDASACPAPGSW